MTAKNISLGWKTCTKCKNQKPTKSFAVDRRLKSGRCSICKRCKSESSALWAKRNRERRNETDAAWKRSKKGRSRDRAHSFVKRALKKGLLSRPGTCEVCGKEAPLEGHHMNYTKPVEVTWLCKRCHGRAHSIDGLKK